MRLFGALLGQQNSVDVGQDTSRGDGDSSEQAVQLLVVLDGKGDVTGHDTALLVVTGGVSGELQDLGAEVLEDGSQVHGGTGSHAGGVLASSQVTADTTDGELKTGLGRRGGGLLLSTTSFSFSCCSTMNVGREEMSTPRYTTIHDTIHPSTWITNLPDMMTCLLC